MKQFLGLILVQLLQLSFSKHQTIPPHKYAEEGCRLQDLLSVDVAQHQGKFYEIKSDERAWKKNMIKISKTKV